MKTPITICHGDGIGPSIMEAVLNILSGAGAQLAIESIELGERVYKRGFSAGIEPSAWDSLRRTKVFLKAPISTPEGAGFKSLEVTLKKTLGLFANIHTCRSFHPFIYSKFPDMDIVIIRENEEDLYPGIEHRQTQNVFQCLKIFSIPGCERIIRYAFEYAKQNNRRKVSCFTKDNILKLTDGLFHQAFKAIAKDYPDIQAEHIIVDTGAAKLIKAPESFDVIVMPNVYGDILSDVAAQMTGSTGLIGTANIGENGAMFEALHGSAKLHAEKNTANPSGLLRAAEMMLVHIGQAEIAAKIQNAWLKTIEDGIHTADVFTKSYSTEKVGTREFSQAVIDRLGKKPEKLHPVSYPKNTKQINLKFKSTFSVEKRELIGVDVFLYHPDPAIEKLVPTLQKSAEDIFELTLITSRGVKVWPQGQPETIRGEHWRCRFKSKKGVITSQDILKLLNNITKNKLEFIKIENLYTFDGTLGYSLGQGE